MRWIGQITYDEVAYFREDVIIEAGNKLGIGTTSPASALHVAGTVQVGVDDTGHDVKFFGATSGASFLYDESENGVVITHPTGAGLEVYTISSAVPSGPQFKVGRDSSQYWGTFVNDRTARLVHRQDESDGNPMNTSFELWGNGSGNDNWVWRHGTRSGGSLATVMTLDKAGQLTVTGEIEGGSLDINGVADISGNTQLGGTLTVGVDDTGHDVKFFGATSGRYLQWDESDDSLKLRDNVKVKFGDGNDLSIHHSGSQSEIKNLTGNLIIQNNADDGDIKFISDDGSGGTATYMTIDGGAQEIILNEGVKVEDYLIMLDSKVLYAGSGLDLRIKHDGSNSYIQQAGTGDLYVQQTVDDKDIVLQCDDGSGGVTAYITLDGSQAQTIFNVNAQFQDDVRLKVGSGGDIQIKHDGSNSSISNATGNLEVSNSADDADIIFKSDDGSGGTTAYLTLDGSATNVKVAKDMRFGDNVDAEFGDGGDFKIYHDGSNTYLEQINSGTGNIVIANANDDADIIFKSDDGSGGTTPYLTLDGSAGTIEIAKDTNIGGNLTISSTAPNLILEDTNGRSVEIDVNGNTFRIDDVGNNAAILQTDLSANPTVTTFFTVANFLKPLTVGVDDTGHDVKFFGATSGRYLHWDESADKLLFRDNVQAVFGNADDLRLLHSGTNSFISNYTGDLIIEQKTADKDIIFKSDNGSGGETAYLTLDGSASTLEAAVQTNFASGVTIDGHLDFGGGTAKTIRLGSQRAYTLPAQGTRMRVLTLADHTYCRVFLESTENSRSQPIVLDIHHRAQGDEKPKIIRSENYEWHAHSNDIRFTSDSSGGAGGATHIYFEKVAYSTGRTVNIRKVETFDGTCTILDGSTTNTGGGAEEAISGRFSSLQTAGDITVGDDVFVADNGVVNFGTGQDLTIQHDGSNTYLNNITGDLIINSKATDKDLILKCDDGSGGETAYITLDGSTNAVTFHKLLEIKDNVKASFGNSQDLQIYHDASNSYIAQGGTGDLYIQQNTADKDIILQSDDGSGGTAEYFRLNGGLASPYTVFPDNSRLAFGAGLDLRFRHDGSSSYIENYTGNLLIRNNQDDGDIVFQSDDGSGGGETYFFLDGSLSSGNPRTVFPDNSVLGLGTGADLQLYHDGSNGVIQNLTGSLTIQSTTDDSDVILKSDDGSGGLAAYLTLDGSGSQIHMAKPIRFPDSVPATWGTGNDLSIFHNGTYSNIANGTGHLYIDNNTDDGDIVFRSDNGAGGLATYFSLDGSLAAHDGSATTGLFTKWGDNSKIVVGNGADGRFYHNATNTFLENTNGDLYIQNKANDKDIIFQSDDGSGGVETYFFLDGSAKTLEYRVPLNIGVDDAGHDVKFFGATSGRYLLWDESGNRLHFQDNTYLALGTGDDALMYHDGTSSYINNYTGNLLIANLADDGDIIFQSDDGSGGTQTYLTIDGGLEVVTVPDTIYLGAGTSFDLSLRHDGSNSHIQNNTGDLTIKNTSNDKDIIFQSDDGSGGVETYFFLDGSANGTSPLTVFPDNSRLTFGNGNDLNISHEANNSYIQNITGDLYLKQRTNDGDMIFQCDDGSGGDATYLTLDGSAGTIEVAKEMNLAIPLATDQQKHLAYFDFEGFSTGDGTNYMIQEINSDTKAPFEHQTSTGSDGLTATTVINLLRTGGHIMPFAGKLTRWQGWVTSSGSGQAVDIGLYKVTLTNNSATDVSPVSLKNTQVESVGNTKALIFAETSFGVTFAAGDILISAIRNGTNAKRCDFASTLVVEWN